MSLWHACFKLLGLHPEDSSNSNSRVCTTQNRCGSIISIDRFIVSFYRFPKYHPETPNKKGVAEFASLGSTKTMADCAGEKTCEKLIDLLTKDMTSAWNLLRQNCTGWPIFSLRIQRPENWIPSFWQVHYPSRALVHKTHTKTFECPPSTIHKAGYVNINEQSWSMWIYVSDPILKTVLFPTSLLGHLSSGHQSLNPPVKNHASQPVYRFPTGARLVVFKSQPIWKNMLLVNLDHETPHVWGKKWKICQTNTEISLDTHLAFQMEIHRPGLLVLHTLVFQPWLMEYHHSVPGSNRNNMINKSSPTSMQGWKKTCKP